MLEGQHLVELVELRPRRGFTERVLRTVAGALVVDPGVLGATAPGDADRHAADHLVRTAGAMVRDVGRMVAHADSAGTRLLTFTLETEVRFATPGEVHDFSEALARAVADVVAGFDSPGGRPFRLVAAGHPAPRPDQEAPDVPAHR